MIRLRGGAVDAPSMTRMLARIRFAIAGLVVRPPRPGDLVEVRVPVAYRASAGPGHLPWVPAGTRAVVRAVGPMPGAWGGAILDILDARGASSGYWTGASFGELRRVTRT